MKHFRVVEKGEHFYPQKKILLWWANFYEWANYGTESETLCVVAFKNKSEAVDYIFKENPLEKEKVVSEFTLDKNNKIIGSASF